MVQRAHLRFIGNNFKEGKISILVCFLPAELTAAAQAQSRAVRELGLIRIGVFPVSWRKRKTKNLRTHVRE